MAILTDGGAVDTGRALVDAAGYSGEAAVRFLLQRQRRQQRRRQLSVDAATRGDATYVNTRDETGRSALISGILLCRSGSPRVVRMLADAGADTASAIQFTTPEGMPFFRGPPLGLLKVYIDQKKEDGASEEALNALKAVHRLLLRVEAVRAVSWLWHTSADASAMSHAAEDKGGTKTASMTPLIRMLPLLRRRADKRGVVLAPLFR